MHPPNVIIIEDDNDIRQTLEDVLGFEGFSVKGFSNGKAALEFLQARENAPCLILLDLMMPGMSGGMFLELREKIDHGIEKIPVFIVSAMPNAEEFTKLGALGCFKKPFDLDILLKVIKKYCSKSAHGSNTPNKNDAA